MNNVYFSVCVNEDGSLTIPAFAARGMGYQPGDSVSLAMPVSQPACDTFCCDDELFISRGCTDAICSGYSVEGCGVNIPARLFAVADIPIGTPINVMAGDDVLILVAGTGMCEDLPCEIDCLLNELGIDAPCVTLGADF